MGMNMTPRVVLVCVALALGSAHGAPIPGLFNTGVNNSGALLAGGSVDPHYRLIQSGDPSASGPNAFVLNDVYPTAPAGPWLKTVWPGARMGGL